MAVGVICVYLFATLICASYFYSLWCFDKLVRLEYLKHTQNWLEDGKPHGVLYFYPPGTTSLRGLVSKLDSSWATRRCFFGWLVRTPAWMARDVEASRRVFGYRVATLTGSGSIFALMLAVAYSLG